ncbi:phage major capsid protein [Bifidobacterium scaligerum]|uniref:Phage major capsid protein n=1 Tax=Bifidobacterium scaligerum TaxID=2052656 RepID=A0A2M9HQD9_9BIFI|nr:phage major capsid protein [Bifidobacterium scaligerum]PJM79023.1 phage major capsid protein [Bifidobacterium scaligerum]
MTTTTLAAANAFRPDSIVPVQEAVPEALALDTRVCTLAGTIEGDAPAIRLPIIGKDPEATVTGEGQTIPESAPALSEVVVRTVKVGMVCEVSREAYTNAQTSGSITDASRRAVTRKLDSLLIDKKTETTSGPGIAHTHGLTEITGAYGTDPILDGIAGVADHNASPTAIIMNFSTWAKLLKVKGTDGRGLIAPEVANTPASGLFGIPVVVNSAAPADTAIIVDSSTILVAMSDIRADVGDGDAFRRDSLIIRVTGRIGMGYTDPAKIAKITFTTK